jgi:predicted CXXCH cytochrome family protein
VPRRVLVRAGSTLAGRPMTRAMGSTAAAFALLSGLLLAAAPAQGQLLPRDQDCIECHAGLDDERLAEPARSYPADIHAEQGFSCLSCHGAIAAGEHGGRVDPEMGFIARPARDQVPVLCGSCHSDIAFMRQYAPSLRVDQEAEYWTSGHGKALREGDPDVATCVSCHPAHSIRPPNDPESSVYPANIPRLCASCHAEPDIMEPHGLPTDQFEAYRASVHGQALFDEEDLSAPTCNDCHGNHGAAPPGVASVERVCGQCHSMMAEYFEGSGHDHLFSEAGLPGCATCHGSHGVQRPSDATLEVVAAEVCVECHEAGDSAAVVFPTMLALIDSLQAAREEAEGVLGRAENLGMEVSTARFELEDVTNAIMKARTAIHAMDLEPVRAEIGAGLDVVDRSAERGEEALWEHGYRRLGLTVSAGLILFLIIGIILKIRALERRPAPATVTSNRPR